MDKFATLFTLFVCVVLAYVGCSEEVDSDLDSQYTEVSAIDTIQVSVSTSTTQRAKSSGPHLLEFKGYPASSILQELSPGPLSYRAQYDPRLDFRYYFPDKSYEVASQEAMHSLSTYLHTKIDTIVKQIEGYRLAPALNSKEVLRKPQYQSGVKSRVNNGLVEHNNASLRDIVNNLNTHRDETYFLVRDTCCYSISYFTQESIDSLQKILAKNNINAEYTSKPENVVIITD